MRDSDEKKKEIEFWNAFARLPLWEQLIVLGTFVAVGVCVFMLIFRIANTSRLNSFHFPDSCLSKEPIAQEYKQTTSSKLDLLIQFPGTDYGCYVGSREYLTSDYTASFQYDDFCIITGVVDPEQFTQEDFYRLSVPAALGIKVTGNETYKSAVYDKGYLNTFVIEYLAGTCHVGEKEYYLVSYLFPVDAKKLCMMVVTDKKDYSTLLKARGILNKIYFSLLLFGEEGSGASDAVSLPELKEVKSGNGGEDVSGSADSSSSATASTEETVDELFERINREEDERAYRIAYPDAKDLDVNVYIDNTFANKDVVIFIEYTEVNSIPREAYVKSPLNRTYKPDCNNDLCNGLVYWNVRNPSIGEWVVHLSANNRYGVYNAGVMELHDFNEMYIAHDDTAYPHSDD